MKIKFYPVIIIVLLIIPFHLKAQVTIGNTKVELRPVLSNLDTPWEILWGPDNKIWFTERYGRISRVDPVNGNHEVLATISDVHEESEAGLMGLVLHPSFPAEPYAYVTYTYLSGSAIKIRLERYTYANNLLGSPVTLLENIAGSGFHDGSRVTFGPDNKIYMTTGDGNNLSAPQNGSTLPGKTLRLNADGSVPDDNPTQGSYYWTLGHRNPQGLVFSSGGKLYSSEHGPNDNDELNLLEKGRNYGWPDVKGFCDTPAETTLCNSWNVREPLQAWTPTLAVAGLDYYDNMSIPEWHNNLLMTTLKDKTLYSLQLNNDGSAITGSKEWFRGAYGRLRDICIAPDGRIFIATSNRDGRGAPVAEDDRIIEIKPILTTSANYRTVGNFKIYPNPLQQGTIIESSSQLSGGTLSVYDMYGKLVFEDILTDTKYELSQHSFARGVYVVQIEKNKQKFFKSFIVL